MEWLPAYYPGDNFCLKIVAFNLLDGKDGRHDHRYNDLDRSGQKRFPNARSLDDGAVKIPKNLSRQQFCRFIADLLVLVPCFVSALGSALLTPISILRGLISSGISRLKSIVSRSFIRLALMTFAWSASSKRRCVCAI